MYSRSNHQISPDKREILHEIDRLYRQLFGQPVPNLYSAGGQLHMSDLLVYKLKLKMKMQGVGL
jgi:hypothetical protein|tara:strand:+ start:312 stop:503 length:192 start_codon:yes stop_codon:yes gene_type:complete